MTLGTIRMRRGDYPGAETLVRQARTYLLAHRGDVDPEMAFIATSDPGNVSNPHDQRPLGRP